MKQQQPYKAATPIPPATIKRDYALAPGRRASKLTAPAAAAAAPAGPAAGSGKHRPKPPAGSTAAAAAAGVTSSASGKQGKSLRNRAGSVGGGGGGSSKSGKKSKNAAASASVDVNVEDATGGAPPAAASAGPSIDSHSMIEDAQLIASVTTTDAMESAVANVGKAQQGDRKLDGDGAEHAAEKAGKLSRKGSGAQVHGAQEGQQETMHLGRRLEDEEESSVTVRPDEAARTDRRAGAGAADADADVVADTVADTMDTSGEDIYEEKEAVVVNGTTAKTTGGEQARAEEIISAADATSAAQEIDEDQIEQLALKVLAMAKDNDHLAEAPNKDSGIVGRAESTEDGADYANDFESAGAGDD